MLDKASIRTKFMRFVDTNYAIVRKVKTYSQFNGFSDPMRKSCKFLAFLKVKIL